MSSGSAVRQPPGAPRRAGCTGLRLRLRQRVQSTPTQTRFDIDAKYSIASDGVVQSVRIKNMEVPAEPCTRPRPSSTPRPTSWPTSSIGEELDLISGRLRIYFEDDFVGESTSPSTSPRHTQPVARPGPTIQVRRKLEGHNNKTNPITGKRELQREWEITVHNRKTQPIRIVIDDQLPLSNDEDVTVKAEALGGGKLNKDTLAASRGPRRQTRHPGRPEVQTASRPRGNAHPS